MSICLFFMQYSEQFFCICMYALLIHLWYYLRDGHQHLHVIDDDEYFNLNSVYFPCFETVNVQRELKPSCLRWDITTSRNEAITDPYTSRHPVWCCFHRPVHHDLLWCYHRPVHHGLRNAALTYTYIINSCGAAPAYPYIMTLEVLLSPTRTSRFPRCCFHRPVHHDPPRCCSHRPGNPACGTIKENHWIKTRRRAALQGVMWDEQPPKINFYKGQTSSKGLLNRSLEWYIIIII